MRLTLQRLRPDLAAPATLAIAILVFAFGSSSVAGLHSFGQTARWALLLLLVAVGALAALARDDVPAFNAVAVAACAGLGLLALASTLWSVIPRLTFERAVSFDLLLVATACLAYSSAGRRRDTERLVAGLVAGAGLVGLAGLLVLAANSNDAVVWSHGGVQASRFRGLGENPNTVSLLFSLAAPAAAWLAVEASTRWLRAGAVVSFLIVYGELGATQSRGALVAMAVGLVAVAALVPRRLLHKALLVGGAGVLIAVAIGIVSIRFVGAGAVNPADPPRPNQVPDAVTTTTSSFAHCTVCALQGFPSRYDDIGNPFFTGEFSLTDAASGSSGRVAAWKGAVRQGNGRPIAGFGFGSEDKVFVDRWYAFVGSRPENGFVGFYLQLGAVGLLAFVGIGLAGLGTLFRVLRRGGADARSRAAVFAAVALAGYVAAVTQSYPYAAGGIAALTLWTALLGLAFTSPRGRPA